MTIINRDNEDLPMGVGFHTAINIPFCKNSVVENYTLKASIGSKWELDNRGLPTEKNLKLSRYEEGFRKMGVNPLFKELDNHYEVKPINIKGKKFIGAVLEDGNKKIRLIYEMGCKYKHMTIWNGMKNKNFICIEPQSCMTNSPNLKLDKSITGFKLLRSNEVWSECCNIYTENF